MRRSYTLRRGPSGERYLQLIGEGQRHSDRFMLVRAGSNLQSAEAAAFIASLAPYLVSTNHESSWPGTQMLGGATAEVSIFRLTPDSAERLSVVDRLFGWRAPHFPDDLCFLRAEGKPWLVTTTHERDAYFFLENSERRDLERRLPWLYLMRDSKARREGDKTA